MTFAEVVMMFGASIAVAIALGQWFIKNQRPTNRWLRFLMISCSVWILLAVCYRIDFFQQYPHLNKLHVPFLSITGPLWYNYLRSLHETNTQHSIRYHIIIPITVTVFLSLPFYFESGEFKREYVETDFDGLPSVMMYTATRYAEITVIVYCIKSILYLRKINQESSRQRSSNTIQFLLIFSILATLAGMTRLTGAVLNLQSVSTAMPTIIISCLLLSLFLLGHRKPVVLGLGRSESHIKLVSDKDVLTLKDCRHQLREKKWYLDPDLKLQKLARKLEISPNRLSELINNADGVNFNEFVNELRIEHAQHLMTKNPRLSNDDVANFSGFNSRSVFYRQFKQKTGITPSEFKKKMTHVEADIPLRQDS